MKQEIIHLPLNHPLMQSFVSPTNSYLLHQAGLVISTAYHWCIRNNESVLRTHAFDLDDTYKVSFANLDFFSPSLKIPAFQHGDMEKLVPDFLLSRTGNKYTLNCDDMFKLDEEQATRLPDVFAQMVLQGLKKRVMQADYCIKILTPQQTT